MCSVGKSFQSSSQNTSASKKKRKTLLANMASKKKDIRAEMSKLAEEANSGTAFRLVDIEERKYKGRTDVWRMDTGDLVRTIQPVQMSMPGT